jgi:thiamine monophosphate synthase
MFIIKKKYYVIIKSIKDIDLKKIKNFDKLSIIYRNNSTEAINELKKFRNLCKIKKFEFFVANDTNLMVRLKADGLYVSANNKSLKCKYFICGKYKFIGAAHNIKEINLKKLQGCKDILFSRLFKTIYKNKKSFLGIVRYNLITNSVNWNFVPLGGINLFNFKKLKMLNCNSIALASAFKEEPKQFLNNFF